MPMRPGPTSDLFLICIVVLGGIGTSMRDTSRRSETGNESSNESMLRADISSACPVQSASRAPSRKRAILLSAAALAMTALLLAAFVGNFEVCAYKMYMSSCKQNAPIQNRTVDWYSIVCTGDKRDYD
jgi:hypothetical protein